MVSPCPYFQHTTIEVYGMSRQSKFRVSGLSPAQFHCSLKGNFIIISWQWFQAHLLVFIILRIFSQIGWMKGFRCQVSKNRTEGWGLRTEDWGLRAEEWAEGRKKFWYWVLAQPPAKKRAVDRKKETLKSEYRITNHAKDVICDMNVECRRNVSYLFIKKAERSGTILRHSIFDILRFAFNLLKFHIRWLGVFQPWTLNPEPLIIDCTVYLPKQPPRRDVSLLETVRQNCPILISIV